MLGVIAAVIAIIVCVVATTVTNALLSLVAASVAGLIGAVWMAAGAIQDNQRETKQKLDALLAIWDKLQVKSRRDENRGPEDKEKGSEP